MARHTAGATAQCYVPRGRQQTHRESPKTRPNLQHVELVVVVGDVGLVELGVVAADHGHAGVAGLRAELVYLDVRRGGGLSLRGSSGGLPLPLQNDKKT